VIFFIIFLVLGLSFGYAAGWPWALMAFVIPGALALVATDRDGSAIVLYFVVTAVGIVAGIALAARQQQQHQQQQA
jgi:hypothetical protein